MKRLYVLFFLCGYSFLGFSQNGVKVLLHLDDYVSSVEQWVYLYSYKSWISGNEIAIFDSARIEKGQHEVTLQAFIAEESRLKLLFTKRGPKLLIFYAEPSSMLEINVAEDDGDTCTKIIKGGNLNNEIFQFINEKVSPLKKKVVEWSSKSGEDTADSVKAFQRQLAEVGTYYVNETSHPCAAFWNYFILEGTSMTSEEKLQVREYLKVRFPHYHLLQVLLKKDIPATAVSNIHSARINQLMKMREQISLRDTSLGAILEFACYSKEGIKVPLRTVYRNYVLVDFWASWCKPCRRETPYIKSALNKYGDNLSVYAVSLDANQTSWQRAIEEDEMEGYIHVIGSYPNGQPMRIIKELGVKQIPANFLLDKEHKIIAKNLRGEELISTLDSLLSK